MYSLEDESQLFASECVDSLLLGTVPFLILSVFRLRDLVLVLSYSGMDLDGVDGHTPGGQCLQRVRRVDSMQ